MSKKLRRPALEGKKALVVGIANELRDTVDYLASSQETEPGDGMAYGEYLRWLNTYPEAPPASLAKAMVETYVKAYAPGGVQVSR